MRQRELNAASRAIIIGTILAAIAAGMVAARYWMAVPIAEIGIAMLACSVLACIQIPLTVAKGRMSLGFAGCLAVILLWGPANAGLVALFEGLTCNVVSALPRPGRRRKPVDATKAAFNAANHALSATVAGLAYVWLAGGVGIVSLRHSAFAALVATVLFFLVNTLDTAAILAASRRAHVLRVWHQDLLWTAPQYLASGAAVMVALLMMRDPDWRWGAALVVPPLYMVFHAYRMYLNKLRSDLEYIGRLNALNTSVIASLATAIDAKDHRANAHLSRVQCYALEMAARLRLPVEQREAIRCAALVHDVGKLGVPEAILAKPGRLTPEEHLRVQKHVEIGMEILKPVRFPWPVMEIVAAHHERWDGLGYPLGLRGEEIPIGARLIAVADTYEALTSDRPYRAAMPRLQAREYLRQLAGTHLDPRLVQVLMGALPTCEAALLQMEDPDPTPSPGERLTPGISSEVMAQITRANSEFITLYDVSQSLPVPVNLDATLSAVTDKIRQLIPCDTCVVFLRTGPAELTAQAVCGLFEAALAGMTLNAGDGISGRVFNQLRPVVNGCPDADLGPRARTARGPRLSSALVVPIRTNSETLGTLSVYATADEAFGEDHLRLLGLIADHTANSIYGARRLHETEEMALRDPLTGLPNARALSNWLGRRLEESIVTHEPFALVLIDLDNFKCVNDRLGHLRGDQALRQAAAAMEECVRSGDLLTRYAGDEFILAVRTADFTGVSELCRRLSQAVDDDGDIDGVRIGASAGFAIYPDDGLNATELIQVADRRMYEEKERRRQAH